SRVKRSHQRGTLGAGPGPGEALTHHSRRRGSPDCVHLSMAHPAPSTLLSTAKGDNSMRVLVTGGAGFFGSHIVDALRARGDDVLVLDDLSTGDRANLDPAVRLVVADISD